MEKSMRALMKQALFSKEKLEAYLTSGGNVNARYSKDDISGLAFEDMASGCTLLHKAASGYNYRMVSWLIEAGADVNVKDDLGRTPLHYVCSSLYGLVKIKALINAGADVNARANDGSTPLLSIARAKHREPGFVRMLLDAGADVNVKDESGITPLQALLWQNDIFLTDVDALIKGGADVRARNCEGSTVLHSAATTDKAEIFRWVCNAGANADVNTREEREGYTPLHIAAQSAKDSAEEIVQELIKAGADVNIKDNRGRAPIFHVRREDVMVALVEGGANVNEMHPSGHSVLGYYLYYRFGGTLEASAIAALLQAGAAMILPERFKSDPKCNPIRMMNLIYRQYPEINKTLVSKSLRENGIKFSSESQ